MDAQGLLNLASSPEASQYLTQGLHKGLEFVGAGALIVALLPKIVEKGKPLAVKLADRITAIILAMPLLRDLIIWKAPEIIKFVHDLFDALEAVAEAFEDRLAQRIAEAAKEPEPTPKPSPEIPPTDPPTASPPKP